MASKTIVNAAPMVIEYGTQDLSTRQVPREPEAIPQHLPKFFIFAQKGPTGPQLAVSGERDRLYGTETFNLRSKYANHATVFGNAVNAQGNTCMWERLIPEDAGPASNIGLWLDVLPTTVDVYERNSDGSIKLDLNGDPTVTGTTTGFKVKFVVTHHATHVAMQNFGQLNIGPGDQTDGLGGQSQRYPIAEFKASSQGEVYNNSGIRLWAPTTRNTSALPTRMMNTEHAYPYFFSVIRRPDANSSPKAQETLFGEQKILFTFKKEVIDPLTDRRMYAGETLIQSYENLTDLRYPVQHGEFGEMKLYDDNIETLLTMFHAAEVPHLNTESDFSADVTQKHLFNFVGGTSSQGVPYHSYVFVDAVNSVRLTEFNNVYAAGGSDGTMTDAVFATLVKNKMEVYLDPNHEVQDLAYNVESIIYDSGFPLETKYALIPFIAERKDTFVVLGTHEVGQRVLEASEEHSIAIALRTRLQMYPESDYFGTPVMRGMIVGRSGKIRNSQFVLPVPATFEVAVKAARYMGAGDGRWKSGRDFDGAPGHIIDNLYDINITWVSASARNRNWDVGLNWIQRFDRRTFFFPALKTVYDDDTSVLNSFPTAMAIGQLNKVAHACWRNFSGVSKLTNAQLIQRVNDFVSDRVQGRFDDRFVIVPRAQITDMDALRGFSWTLPIDIFAPNMKTVMTTFVRAFRIEDLEAEAA